MRSLFLFAFGLIISLHAYAERNPEPRPERKSALATKTIQPPEIDGFADDSVWHTIHPVTDFVQYQPVYNAAPTFRTEVKIAYDDFALYIFAKMYDPNPDSILRQLGLRDEDYLNADMFTIGFDTYNNQLDAYYFTVTASGVQTDLRESDQTYDAVWESKAIITQEGWNAELKIPYSALRFASKPIQEWGMEISRNIRRYRESDQWSLEKLEAYNDLPYWGLLVGIENIKPPLRLSATPYLLLQAEHYPDQATSNDFSTAFGGGLDMKYGFNESYTLDMTLLPDFSQVQSDNKVKNLTAFETVYEEQRPFFNEAVDLFMKGDIFYSRRIGKTPTLFYSASNNLNEDEHLLKNPVQQRLLNATKISGRNKKGLAIGLLNAVTAHTYAIAQNEEGGKRKIITDPLTNYNLVVLDQALKNNSDFYITNTNVLRSNSFRKSNVTATGLTLNNKSNSYRVTVSGGMSGVTNFDTTSARFTNTFGFKYGVSFSKTSGNLKWNLYRGGMNNKFDANDMGLTMVNNYHNNSASVEYNIYKPFWKLREMNNTITFTNQNNFTTHKPETAKVEYNLFFTTLNYFFVWFESGHHFTETYDYYEPRIDGMFYLKPKSTWVYCGFSSDYRKQFSLDGGISVYSSSRDQSKGISTEFSPIVRMNDHFTFRLSSNMNKNINDYGYAASENGDAIFGNREISTVVNSFNSKYLFKNDVSLSVTARHYYAQGKYKSYFILNENGRLEPIPNYTKVHDFSFNTFTIDMVFSWIFAPGSSLNLVWKNDITKESELIRGSYFNNLNDTFHEPQLNNISLKVLYYIDYLEFKKMIRPRI